MAKYWSLLWSQGCVLLSQQLCTQRRVHTHWVHPPKSTYICQQVAGQKKDTKTNPQKISLASHSNATDNSCETIGSKAKLTKWLKAVQADTKQSCRLTQKWANVCYENIVPLCSKLSQATHRIPGWTRPLDGQTQWSIYNYNLYSYCNYNTNG